MVIGVRPALTCAIAELALERAAAHAKRARDAIDRHRIAMSGDGSLVLGGIGDSFFTIPSAFVWSEAAGTRACSR